MLAFDVALIIDLVVVKDTTILVLTTKAGYSGVDKCGKESVLDENHKDREFSSKIKQLCETIHPLFCSQDCLMLLQENLTRCMNECGRDVSLFL